MDPHLPWDQQEPIPHRNIPSEVYDKYSDFFSNPNQSVSDKDKRILSSPFLTSLLERRPEDATFNEPFVRFLSPMVRYSKLPFRMLCRKYGADLAFTPMILAKDINRGGYVTERVTKEMISVSTYQHAPSRPLTVATGYQSSHVNAFNPESLFDAPPTEVDILVPKLDNALDSSLNIDEFTTCPQDRPLIAQLAGNDPIELGKAAEVFAPYVDGFDINCGCPQTWVIQEGIGAVLSSKPELVQEILREVRKRTNGSLSVKIRLRPDLQQSVELIRRAEQMGVEWITVHGRTRAEKTALPVSSEAIRLLKSVSNVCVIFNGDVNTPSDMANAIKDTGADGVLCARGALANPGLFCNVASVPESCFSDYINIAIRYGGLFGMHQHHLAYMQYGCASKAERSYLTRIKSMAGIMDYFASKQIDLDLDNSKDVTSCYAAIYSPSQTVRDYSYYPSPLYDIPGYTHLSEDTLYNHNTHPLSTGDSFFKRLCFAPIDQQQESFTTLFNHTPHNQNEDIRLSRQNNSNSEVFSSHVGFPQPNSQGLSSIGYNHIGLDWMDSVQDVDI